MLNKQQQYSNEQHSSPFAQWRQYASMARPIHTPQRRVRAVEQNPILDDRAREAEKFRILKNAFDSMRLLGGDESVPGTRNVTATAISKKKSVRLEPLRTYTTNNTLSTPKGKDTKTQLEELNKTTGGATTQQHQLRTLLNLDETMLKKKEPQARCSAQEAVTSIAPEKLNGEFPTVESEETPSVLSPAKLRDKIASLLPEFQQLCQNLSIFAAMKESMREHKEEWRRILEKQKRKRREKMKMEKEQIPRNQDDETNSVTIIALRDQERIRGLNHQEYLKDDTVKEDMVTTLDDKERAIRSEYQGLFTMMEKTGQTLHSFDEGLWRLYAVFDKYVEMFFIWEDATESKHGCSHDLLVSKKYTSNLKNYARQILKGVLQMNATYSSHDTDNHVKSEPLHRIKEEEG